MNLKVFFEAMVAEVYLIPGYYLVRTLHLIYDIEELSMPKVRADSDLTGRRLLRPPGRRGHLLRPHERPQSPDQDHQRRHALT